MRQWCLALSFMLVAGLAQAQSAPLPPYMTGEWARMDRLERWLYAVREHEPGVADQYVNEVASWNASDLRLLWTDVQTLAALSRYPSLRQFIVWFEDGSGRSSVVRYDTDDFKRLQQMACAMSGRLDVVSCHNIRLNDCPDLLELIEIIETSRVSTGGDNYVLRRGALLQMDVAMLGPSPQQTPSRSDGRESGPRRARVEITDGQGGAPESAAIHWSIAYALLEFIVPKGEGSAAPAKDPMVRDWYASAALWMQHVGTYDRMHLDRALRLFPNDPEINFLAGCEHQWTAGAELQSAAREVRLPADLTLGFGDAGTELRAAELHFRRALSGRPEWPEARLRLGRVLALQGDTSDAAREFKRALAGNSDAGGDLVYYGTLFLGDVEEAEGHLDEARRLYDEAARLRPDAPAPKLALAQLAHRRGDRAAALTAMQPIFDTGRELAEADEPWWDYLPSHARDADLRVEELRRPFNRGPSR